MIKNTLLFVVALGLSFTTFSQNEFTVMAYNILKFDQTDSDRLPYFKTIMDEVQPDILVLEEVVSETAFDMFVSQALDATYDKGTYIANSTHFVQTICFKKDRFKFVSNTPIPTAARDINMFTIVSLETGDTLRVFGLHLKAGSIIEDQDKRLAEIQELRKVTDNLKANQDFLIVGDFNIYGADEAVYQLLKSPNGSVNGQVVDPITMTGVWNNFAYAQYHTQSPRQRSFGGGVTGGMDDRFDMILYSQSIANAGGLEYVDNSTWPVGNDGNHYNDSVNEQPNTSVSVAVANALHYGSDHLPITAKFRYANSTIGVDTQTSCGAYTWIDGIEYTTDNNTATHVLVGAGAGGADSTVRLNLTILNKSYGTDTRSSCAPIVWIDGNTYANSNTTAKHTLVGAAENGCDSIVTLNLTIGTLNTNVTTSDLTLTAEQAGVQYQWLNCTNNYAVISGATNQVYVSSVSGTFAVRLAQANCVDTSDCMFVVLAGLEDQEIHSLLQLHPNPTTGKFKLNYPVNHSEDIEVRIMDVQGRIVYQEAVQIDQEIELLGEKGVYMVQLLSSAGVLATTRIVKY